MVLVGLVQQVVGSDIQLGYLLAFHLNVGTCREREQRIAGRLGFGVVSTIDVRLTEVAVEACGNVEVVQCHSVLGMIMAVLMHGVRTDRAVRVVLQLPFQLRRPFGRRGERQVFRGVIGMQQLRIYIREGVGEVHRVDGMNVHTSLEAQQARVTLGVGVGQVAFLHFFRHTMGEDVVVYAVGKECQLCRDVARREVHAQVGLQTVFRLQLLVAQFVADAALVHTVRRQFTHVRRTETAGHVQLDVQVVVHVEYGTDATRHTIEVAREIHETLFAVLHEFVAVQSAVVVAHAAIQRPAVTERLRGGGIESEVKQTVVGNEIFLALVLRRLIHAADACRQLPSVPFVGDVTHVVGQRVQLEIQLVVIHRLLILLTAVLLIADDGLQIARREVQRIVPHDLVVFHLLEGQRLSITMTRPPVFMFQFARLGVALALDDAWRQVVGRCRQSRVPPPFVHAQHQASCLFAKLRTRHVVVIFILIRVRHLLAPARVPHKTFLVAGHLQRVVEEAVIGLVFRTDIGAHVALGQCRLRMHDDHTSHRVRAVHQRCRTLQYLDAAHTAAIHFHAVLVAPLLTFLAHTLAHHHHAVVTQSADDGFRDAAARRQLVHTRLMTDGVDDVRRGRRPEHLWRNDAHRCRCQLQLRVARHARHRYFVQVQMAEEYVRRVLRMIMFIVYWFTLIVIILCCHCRAYTQQQQNDIFCFHS